MVHGGIKDSNNQPIYRREIMQTYVNIHGRYLKIAKLLNPFHSCMQIRRSITEILELCFTFGEWVLGLSSEKFSLSVEKLDSLERISKVHMYMSACCCCNICSKKLVHQSMYIAQYGNNLCYNLLCF